MEELSSAAQVAIGRLARTAQRLHAMNNPSVIQAALMLARCYETPGVRSEVRAVFDKFRVPLAVKSALNGALYDLYELIANEEPGVTGELIEDVITNPSAAA